MSLLGIEQAKDAMVSGHPDFQKITAQRLDVAWEGSAGLNALHDDIQLRSLRASELALLQFLRDRAGAVLGSVEVPLPRQCPPRSCATHN